MQISSRLIILITILLSSSYIFALDYYDKKETKVQDIYQKVSLPEITYTDISIELRGIKQTERLSERELAERQSEILGEFSHELSCSKLCTQMHAANAESELIQGEKALELLIKSIDNKTPYRFSIKVQKDIGYNTYYKFNINGLQNTHQIDHLRGRAARLLEKWRIKPKESIYFIGKIDGRIDQNQKKEYVEILLRQLNAVQRDYYQDDNNQDVEAYYAYTKSFKEYTLSQTGQKTNMQVSFSYHETDDITQITIAFPFYNQSF